MIFKLVSIFPIGEYKKGKFMDKLSLEDMVKFLIENKLYTQEDLDFMDYHEVKGAYLAETE